MHKDPERTTFISIYGRQASLYHLLLTPSVGLLQEFKPRTDISTHACITYHISEEAVKTPSFKDSGDIHRTGSKPLPPFR